MGWSDKSNHMVRVYTRGAEIDLAATQPRVSIARRWRGKTAIPVAAASNSQTVVSPQALLTADLLNTIRNNPALVRTLLEALHGTG
jgi:hypothetical protein